jgi:hypothetical protein
MLNKLFILSIFFILVFCFSCEEQGLIVKCSDCTINEPVDTQLDIKLDKHYQGTNIVLNIYEGNLEDSILYLTYTTGSPAASITVTLNKEYTVTSTYFSMGIKYVAVDSATPRVRYEKDQCDDPCYFVYDRKIDLRLKYTK